MAAANESHGLCMSSAVAHHDVIVIGASSGGVEALTTLLALLPEDLTAAIFIVVHVRPDVPSYLPGKSPFAGDFAYRYGIPVDAAKGGPETTYPEYQAKLRTLPRPTKPAGPAAGK